MLGTDGSPCSPPAASMSCLLPMPGIVEWRQISSKQGCLHCEIKMIGEAKQPAPGWPFLRTKKWAILAISVVTTVPCLWHRRIEAGDLGSHVYNAWLAQLIARGQAPGLYLVRRWNNVLFDWMLLHVANVVGFAAAEKIVVSAAVVIFFLGVFAF